MATLVDLTGLDRTTTRFRRLVNPDAAPLMVTWSLIIQEDNRKGVMAGLDKDGLPMPPVTYRPIYGPGRDKNAVKRLTKLRAEAMGAGRHGQKGNLKRGRFVGIGVQGITINNNLTSAQYRVLAGPPLAPRGAFSRVITNLRTRFGQMANTAWEAVGYWDEVVTRKGRQFLHYHFDGAPLGRGKGNLPKRDLCGVRPEGKEKARKSARAWMLDMIRSSGA